MTRVTLAILFVLPGVLACGSGDGDPDAGRADAYAGADSSGNLPDGLEEHCGQLTATVRDFLSSHPDMELGDYGPQRGLVEPDLGPGRKPVYAPSGPTWVTAGQEEFDLWYRDDEEVNIQFEVPITMIETSPSLFVFEDAEFFPIDGVGWEDDEINGHNYHFTTEIHTAFEYEGGETLTFTGDDDVWIFVNGKLALDMGVVHTRQTDTIDFDAQAGALWITPGEVYRLDLFHAERHTSDSYYRIETSIDCLLVE